MAIIEQYDSCSLLELERLITAYEAAGAALTGFGISSTILALIHDLKLKPATFTHVYLTLLHFMAVRHRSTLLSALEARLALAISCRLTDYRMIHCAERSRCYLGVSRSLGLPASIQSPGRPIVIPEA